MVQLLAFCTRCLLLWGPRINLLLQNKDTNSILQGLVCIRLFGTLNSMERQFAVHFSTPCKVQSLLPSLTSKRGKALQKIKATTIFSNNCGVDQMHWSVEEQKIVYIVSCSQRTVHLWCEPEVHFADLIALKYCCKHSRSHGKTCLYMLGFVSSPLVYMPDPSLASLSNM